MRVIKLYKHGNSFAVVIPRSVYYRLNWRRGDHLSVDLGADEKSVVIRSVQDHLVGVQRANGHPSSVAGAAEKVKP